MTDLDALSELEQRATPRQYWSPPTTGQCYGLWYRHYAEGPHTNKKQAGIDAELMMAARNALPALIAELRAARLVVAEAAKAHRDNPWDGWEESNMNSALAAYTAAVNP